MSNSHGRFVWYELMTPDPDRVTHFYAAVAGWGTRQWNPATAYTMWINGDAPIGGLWPLNDEHRARGLAPQWLPYVGVADVDATVAEAVRLGASVLRAAEDVPGAGRFAVLHDPQGAPIAVYASAASEAQPASEGGRGHFSWHELATTDSGAAFSFYQRLFGWGSMGEHDMGAIGSYRLYGREGQMYGGMHNHAADQPGSPRWLCYVQVDDVHRAAETVGRHGGQVVSGPMEVPGGSWVAQCTDPEGAVFAVHQLPV